MDRFSFLNLLRDVGGILNESRKLFPKNKKLMLSILVFHIYLYGLVYSFNVFAIKPEITNLIQESSVLPMMDPSTPEYLAHLLKVFEEFRYFIVYSYIFVAVSSIMNLLSVLIIVHASAFTHKDGNVKEFPALTLRSLKGPLVTYSYIILFSLGYWFIFLIILFPILLLSTSFGSLAATSGILFVLFSVFESYLAIVWYLSLVISILEETYGIHGLGKAAKIVKGMKRKLFLLNLFFGFFSFGLVQMVRQVDLNRSFAVTLSTSLVLVSLIAAVRMFQLVSYTVAYFHCKRLQGKDVESLTDVEYTNYPPLRS